MATGFEDDFAMVASGSDKQTAMELTKREKAMAQGRAPDESPAEAEEDVEAEADDTEVEGKDAAASTSASEEEVDGEESGDSESAWIDDSVKELAESYGIDEESLGSFESEKDFRRFAGILEKTIGKAEEKPAEPKPAASAEEQAVAGALDVSEFESDGYDENTLKIVKSVSALQGVVKDLQQRLADGDKQRTTDALHREIDTLGGRFGKSDSLTSVQRKSRDVLIDAIEIVKQNLEKRGVKASSAVVLRRAELVAFGDEVLAEEKAKQKEALSESVKKQSAKRRSVGRNTKPPTRRERPGEARDPAKAIANDPALIEFWNNAQD